ncbi:MAG: DNA polymerase I [Elusimicrobia bacterium]|nr:DNA polymerase I [Elusimicrobiota bacterium]
MARRHQYVVGVLTVSKTLYLVDAHGYLHRAYHALPPLTNSKGEPVGALFGFTRMLTKIIRLHRPDRLVVCFDDAAPTFRHKAYTEYKAHRKEIDDALKFQLPMARSLVDAWGLSAAVLPGYEADDVIATLAERGARAGFEVVVVTADKDALQLVGGPISVLNEQRGVRYDAAEVEKKYGLRPDQMVDYFALVGDSSDNVPGVPGVGDKTATTLLNQFGTLDALFERLDQVKGALKEKLRVHEKEARLSRSLVVLERDVPLPLEVDTCRIPDRPSEDLLRFVGRLEFNSLLPELKGTAELVVPTSKDTALPAPDRSDPPAPNQPVNRTVHTVLTDTEWDRLLKELRSASVLAVDVETTGLDPFSCKLVGVSLSTKVGTAWYVPVGHAYLGAPAQLPLEKVRSAMAPFLADPGLPKVGHNLKFDSQVLARAGMLVSPLSFDTMVASYCLNPGRQTHGLKALALDVLGESMASIETLIGKGAKQITMDQVKIEDAAPYAGADAEVSLRLKEWMEPLLKEKALDSLFQTVEMPLVPILSAMEEAGVALDVPYLHELAQSFGRDIARLQGEIHALAEEPVNVNSPKQLAVILFEKLKLPVVRKTKTGFSTDEDVLQKLSHQHPLPAKILAYRELAKLKSTYIDALLALVRESGRVHTSFNQTVAATGRLSSSEPNLQNIPIRTDYGRKIRRAFVAQEGWTFLSADYSQIDLRVLAHITGDPALVAAFRRGDDIHSATARDIFSLGPQSPVSDDQRRVAKTVNFGIVYGQTGFGLSQQLGIPMGQAQSYINAYLEKYAGVKSWMAQIIEEARRNGYVTTLLNRRRYLPEIKAANAAVRGFAERTAMNTPIQGTSADIIKLAMIRLAGLFETKGWNTRMLLQVHDDLLFEVPVEEFDRVAQPIQQAMENALSLSVPLVVDLKKGPNWADMKRFVAHA